jgi:membrane protein DedA with SNARE-associated domain
LFVRGYTVIVSGEASGAGDRLDVCGGFVLGDVGQLVLDVIGALGYVGLVLLLIAENLFPPIPSEVVLPLAGFLVGRGDLNLWGALVAATFGSVAGAVVLYGLGRWGGRRLVLRYGKWLRVDEQGLRNAEGWFRRYGDWVVLVARVVPVARSIVSIPAGTAKMPMMRFVVLTTLGSAAWNGLLIGAGVALGANWEIVQDWIGSYSNVVLVVGAVTIALFLLLRHFRREKKGQ